MSVLAFDLGASSGRAVLGLLRSSRIEIKEVHRFSNNPVFAGDRMHWDILRILHEMKQGLLKAKHEREMVSSVGIDSWAVDFGIVGKDGGLLGNPYHYRDPHTSGVMEEVLKNIPAETIFRKTGIQFLPFNTIYQLAALKKRDSYLIREGAHLLMIPDLLRFFLTGEIEHEFTNATTTQLYNPGTNDWDRELIHQIGIPSEWFGSIAAPGTEVGMLRSSVTKELGVSSVPFIAVAEHDTGSAIAAVPATDGPFAYLSCGTWSLMGTEVDAPIINEKTLACNFTNEGGVGHTYRLLKNIMGLWIFQETIREWEQEGVHVNYDKLLGLAEQAVPFQYFIDPDDPLFLPAGKMTSRIREYCLQTQQGAPESQGEMVRCILESLTFKYRYVFELTEQLSGHSFSGLHMVGGGIHNRLLCAWTASAIGKPVYAGPVEASAIGNVIMQWIHEGVFQNVTEARKAIKESFPVLTYEPENTAAWNEAYFRYVKDTNLGAYV